MGELACSFEHGKACLGEFSCDCVAKPTELDRLALPGSWQWTGEVSVTMTPAHLLGSLKTAESPPVGGERGTREVGRIALSVARLFQREPVS